MVTLMDILNEKLQYLNKNSRSNIISNLILQWLRQVTICNNFFHFLTHIVI